MQSFHFHGNFAHDIGHNTLILMIMVQQIGVANIVVVMAELWRRHA